MEKKGHSGNPKLIDFYAGLKLDGGPLNPGRKTWKEAVKEERLKEEMDAVDSLDQWEKQVLKEANPKLKIGDNDDSD